MRRRIDFCGSLVIFGALWLASTSVSASADDLVIRNGTAKAFLLSVEDGGVLRVLPARGEAGAAPPRQGEIIVSISTTHAVGYPKLHVYNRYGKAIAFKFAAMKDGQLLSTSDLCGRNDTDSWIVLPSATTDVRLSRVTQVVAGCL